MSGKQIDPLFGSLIFFVCISLILIRVTLFGKVSIQQALQDAFAPTRFSTTEGGK